MSQGYASAGLLSEPGFQDWTPTLVNMTKGDGTIVARARHVVGGLVTIHFEFILGSTSTVGTSPTISTPVNASSSYTFGKNWIGNMVLDNSGTETLTGMVRVESATTLALVALVLSGTHMRQSDITATIPFTWATGDLMACTAEYEPA